MLINHRRGALLIRFGGGRVRNTRGKLQLFAEQQCALFSAATGNRGGEPGGGRNRRWVNVPRMAILELVKNRHWSHRAYQPKQLNKRNLPKIISTIPRRIAQPLSSRKTQIHPGAARHINSAIYHAPPPPFQLISSPGGIKHPRNTLGISAGGGAVCPRDRASIGPHNPRT